jgi:hypothetical protein
MKESEEIRQALHFLAFHGNRHPDVIQACEVLGISLDELAEKNVEQFGSDFGGKDFAEFNFRNFEARRRAKLLLIGKFLVEKGVVLTPSSQSPNVSSTRLQKNYIFQLPSPSARRDFATRNLEKKVKVRENLKIIKINEEKMKKFHEEKILEKSCRHAKQRFTTEQRTRLAKRDLKTKEILLKKYQEIEDHERRAISSMSVRKEDQLTQSSFNTPSKINQKISISKQSLSVHSHDEDPNIDEKLKEISLRLSKSSERAKQVQAHKISSLNQLTGKIRKVRATKDLIESQIEAKNIEKVFKIKKDFFESCVSFKQKRKEELLGNEQKRISISLKNQTTRWNQEYSKIELAFNQREKNIEDRIRNKEKTFQNFREGFERRNCESAAKALVRKKEHDAQVCKMQRDYEHIRLKMITRAREKDLKSKDHIFIVDKI